MSSRFLVETHAHTSLVSPCGRLSPARLARHYARAGYTALIITDHFTATLPILAGSSSWRERVERYFSGFRAARAAGARHGLAVFPGIELTHPDMTGKDFLVYGIDEERLAALPDLFAIPFTRFRALASEIGALVFQAHPYRNGEPAAPELLDGLEVYNGNPRHDSRNDLALAFARRHRLLESAGSDAHRREDVGQSGMAFARVPASPSEIVTMLRDSSGDTVVH